MASADLDTRTENDPTSNGERRTRIGWDSSIGATPLGHGWHAEPLVIDWFEPGHPDLLVTAGGGVSERTARVYRRRPAEPGHAPRYDAGELVPGLEGLRSVCVIPNGSASRFDLVGLAQNGLVLLPNKGQGDRPEFNERVELGIAADLGFGPCRVVQIVALDWDGDGLTDLVVGLDDLSGYWPDSDRLPQAQQVGFNQKGGHPGYDRGGLWRGQAPTGRLFWLRNIGQLGAPAFELQPEIGSDADPLDLGLHPAALTVAWGGGGSLELLVTDRRGLVRIYRNFGGQRPPVLMEPRTLQCGHAALQLPDDRTVVVAADLDGDQRVELIYGTSAGRVFSVHSGPTRNDAKTPVELLSESSEIWLAGHAVVTAGDLDADGDLDLVFGDATGRLHLVQDMGTRDDHRYHAPVAIEGGGTPFRVDPGPDGMLDGPLAPRLGYSCPTLADWTGNGRLDLLVSGAGGEILFLRNDGAADSPRFGAPSPLRCDGGPLIIPPRVRPAVADWNASGQADLIALDLQGFLCVFPRTGTHDVGAPVPLVDRLGRYLRLDGGFGQAGRCSLWAGPWTGSGLTDLLVGLPRANRHVIPALTGLPLGDPESLPTVILLENVGHGRVVPRLLRYRDGRPVIIGSEGCSPSGIDGDGQGTLDLLVSGDDGRLHLVPRGDLQW
ncbi:hypothetical protein SAMN05444166_1981 [Singulisphaera sp. GP187]|uniref:hypothetical protein n=1 Tax=Singulisphaera sp. GP187 TaxID=1882752 RepID=UPI00092C9410|nr:hypothetical protein [Singulisphaera sp. GP187]SIO00052.1 hypothetical protein SAMN05444166_1981 [Singulisphaera sp. GP187]